MNRNTLFAFVSAALVSASLALSGCFAQAPDSDEGTGEVGQSSKEEEDTSEAEQPLAMQCQQGCMNFYHYCLKRCTYKSGCADDCTSDYTSCIYLCPQP